MGQLSAMIFSPLEVVYKELCVSLLTPHEVVVPEKLMYELWAVISALHIFIVETKAS